jgi:hypothetical protein
MPGPPPTAAKLAELMVAVITGVEGGTEEHWRAIIGPVEQRPILYNVRSNWAVYPGGTPRERTVITHTAEIVRQTHPYVNG